MRNGTDLISGGKATIYQKWTRNIRVSYTACKRGYEECHRISDCPGIPTAMKDKIFKRHKYLSISRSNKCFENKKAVAEAAKKPNVWVFPGLPIPVVKMSIINAFDGERCTCLISAVHPPSEVTKALKVRIGKIWTSNRLDVQSDHRAGVKAVTSTNASSWLVYPQVTPKMMHSYYTKVYIYRIEVSQKDVIEFRINITAVDSSTHRDEVGWEVVPSRDRWFFLST